MAPKRPPSQRATIQEVARYCGVAPSTVSNALRGQRYVQPQTRDRIIRAVAELGYRPSGIAASLRLGRSGTIALIGASLADPRSAQILLGVEEASLSQGYHVVICNTAMDHDRETQHISLLLDKRIDGAIVMSSSLHDQNISWLQRELGHLVLLSRRPANLEASFVGLDDWAGMRAIVQHLTDLGHQRIAFLGGVPSESSVTRHKVDAFTAELGERQLAPVAIEASGFTFDDGYQTGRRLLQRFAQHPITAIIAVNDITGLGVIEAALELGLAVPSDLSVVGWDDVFPASLRTVQLTTVRQPTREMGKAAAEMLLHQLSEHIDAREEIIFQPELVVRRTTGVPPMRRSE